jgi:hypothetical protein
MTGKVTEALPRYMVPSLQHHNITDSISKIRTAIKQSQNEGNVATRK